ncbi:hypothetical protein VE03_10098 [Pseudogymnoascus sp. 23342-1-I1]|nr:hypothetical protein VE03_10098 [Pseudogymnoascus sp. 23342-1-I1]
MNESITVTPIPPGSCLCGDEGQHELPERRCGRSVVRLLPGYSNIKRSIRYNPEDLLVTQVIATAALTLPESAAKGSARVRAIQQPLLRRMQGSATPDDPAASRPFARLP